MSVRIERIDKDGTKWAVSGATQGELETGVAALQKALARAEEKQEIKRGPGRPPKNGAAVQKQIDVERIRVAIAVLRSISAAPSGGQISSALTAAAGLPAASKALGPVM